MQLSHCAHTPVVAHPLRFLHVTLRGQFTEKGQTGLNDWRATGTQVATGSKQKSISEEQNMKERLKSPQTGEQDEDFHWLSCKQHFQDAAEVNGLLLLQHPTTATWRTESFTEAV